MDNNTNDVRRRLIISAAALPFAAAPVFVGSVHAKSNDYPNRPVKLLVPFVAGGGADIAARVVAQKLAGVWGQSVVVDNQGGAGGNIGTGVAAKAVPDGYTLLIPSGSILTVNPHLYKTLPFDGKRDFAPITKLVSGPHVLIVNTNFPAKNLKEFIALLKSKPGQFNFASAGIGSQTHMAAEQFLHAAGLDATHVPYKGEGGIYPDLMSGQVQFAVGNISVVSGQLSSGRLRALAVTSATRSSILPDVPTMAESGLDGFENLAWFGLMAPAKTPAEIVEKIYQDTARVLSDPEVKARFQQMGVSTVGNSPARFADEIRRESDQWQKIVAARRLTVS
ncbi:tripartite tricarboxylate transporter substrate binding protein [Imbroritus primus]|uniref:Tripartite tricarboxylate transporter substrate binding protein n=2 Tax=Imbroritus primus TaxID=3058603 RepID=A0ACD3SL19_9BURK|nr:tripartite tricarboxylate transporter substrate binding protein [Burkholderiaceae bacterium PBA]